MLARAIPSKLTASVELTPRPDSVTVGLAQTSSLSHAMFVDVEAHEVVFDVCDDNASTEKIEEDDEEATDEIEDV